jgi:hypothetical protein
MRKFTGVFIVALFLGISCRSPHSAVVDIKGRDLSAVLSEMTDVMLHDVTSPPLAARFFAYACLSGYEILSQNDSSLIGMHGVLNDYPDLKKPDTIKASAYRLAALLAVMETASKMQPSGFLMGRYQKRFLDSIAATGVEEETIADALAYARYVSKKILAYAKADGYNKISNLPRYTPLEKEGSWYPTPPAYMAAVEPYFNAIRSFTLDSNAQFKPVPPIEFSSKSNSGFVKQMLENYNEGKPFPEDSLLIAAFWDCNPFALQDGGHLQVGLKKISPGAHWLGITGIACERAKKDFSQTMYIHTMVSVALTDAFIVCWDEKYRSNRVRPETAIRKYKDPNWRPLLQTPPFPEYPSGHSTISNAASAILTDYFGDHFGYTDTVEVRFGLPPRTFSSFRQAADEAAISRFYGGIHFKDAIVNGQQQGMRVGEWILAKTSKRKTK